MASDAPRMSKLADGEEVEEVDLFKPILPVWVYGINDHLDVDVLSLSKEMAPTGNFSADICALAEKAGVVPHSMLASKKPAESEAGKVIAVTSTLIDKVNVELFASCIPAAPVETVRFSQAALDCEMAMLVAESTKDCQVRCLHLDWNKIEVALGEIALPEPKEGDEKPAVPKPADIDEAERQRRAKQEKRELFHFAREVTKIAESVQHAVEHLKVPHGESGEWVVEKREWVPVADFVQAFVHFGLERIDVIEAAEVLDGPYFGTGDGGILLQELPEVCKSAVADSVPQEDEEARVEFLQQDEIGKVFASFLTGKLERVSFRSCAVGYLEIYAVAAALPENSVLLQLNLYQNRLDDKCCKVLADAMADNHTLQYLGLGKNRIGNEGLAALGEVCGMLVDEEMFAVADARKKDQEAKKAAHVDLLIEVTLSSPTEEEKEAGQEPVMGKYWSRNQSLRTLDFTGNRVSDRAVIDAMQPWGYKAPALMLKDNPVAESLRATPCVAPSVRPEVGEDILMGWAVDAGPAPKPSF